MKKSLRDKKIIILIIISIVLLSIISIVGYRYYQQQEVQKKIDVLTLQLENKENGFNEEDTREDKVSILKSILEEHTDYEKSKDMIEEIDEKYHLIISNMQNTLKEEYDKTLTDNTLKDIDKISDKEQLNNAKTKLNELLQTIQNEKDIVCTENEVKEYETKITDLVKSYEDRVTTIEKEEQAKKEAEEKKIKEETERQAALNSQNSSDSNSSGGSSSNQSSSENQKLPWYYGMEHVIAWNEKGEKTEFYRDSAGNLYDMNGNCINW